MPTIPWNYLKNPIKDEKAMTSAERSKLLQKRAQALFALGGINTLAYPGSADPSVASALRPAQVNPNPNPQIPETIQQLLKSDGYPPHPVNTDITQVNPEVPVVPIVPAPTSGTKSTAVETYKPAFDLAKLIELSKNVGSTMDIQGAMKEPANSMASILGVNDASYLKGLMPEEVFKLAQTRAENSYKDMLTKNQAVDIANNVSGRTTQIDMLKSLVSQGMSADNAMTLANFNQNREDKRVTLKAIADAAKPTKADMEAKVWAKKLRGEPVSEAENQLIKEDNTMNINTAFKVVEQAGRGMMLPEGPLRSMFQDYIDALPMAQETINSFKKESPTAPAAAPAPAATGTTNSGTRFTIEEVK